MKILLLNLGYESGLDGSMYDYLVHGLRYLHTPSDVARAIETSVENLIFAEQPDICCFLELHSNTALVKDLREYKAHHIDNKYGKNSWLKRLPFFSDNCNGFFARKEIPYKTMYFEHGTKKLIYELKVANDVSLLLAHFSLSEATRKEQFAELEKIIRSRDQVVVGGDFNIFRGTRELDTLVKDCDLKIVNNQPTFPAVHPTKMFDLFLCSENIKITRCEAVRGFHGSDHLPVILEFKV